METRTLSLVLVLAVAGHLVAATRTWDGEGGDASFSDPLNWDGNLTPPTSGGDLLQAGANLGGVPFIGFDYDDEFRAASFIFLSSATAYTVTPGSGNDMLTLTGTGTALLNSSSVRQTFQGLPLNVGASQTWNGGAQGLILSQIDLGMNHTLTIDGAGSTSSKRNELTGAITGTGASGLIKTGAGTLLFNTTLPSDYTGATGVISGTLQLGSSNQIPDSSRLVLSGGTFSTGGFDDIAGALSLGGNATLDFGVSGASHLVFAASQAEAWSGFTLNIQGYTGSDRLRFGDKANALTSAQLAEIRFNGTTPAQIDGAGFVSPVPELSLCPALVIGGSLLVVCSRRRHLAR